MSTKKQVHRVMWIKVSENGRTAWVNTSQVRSISERHKGCSLAFTSRHSIEVDQPLEDVVAALGYKMPPRPPIEGLEIEHDGSPAEKSAADEDQHSEQEDA